MYALVDCNAFFASCEQIFRPDLRGKPVVVLSNNDGCIVARNAQAKALKIPDLIPYFKIKSFLQHHQVQVFSSNYELYGDISQRVMQQLKVFCDHIEIYSIDEAFLQLPDHFTHYQQLGWDIKNTIFQRVGMPVGVGIGATKTLAKLASYIGKNSNKCGGVCVIQNIPSWQKVFEKIPVKKIWGIGRQLEKKLAVEGIFSVWQLIGCDPHIMQRRYSVNMGCIIQELNGTACLSLELSTPNKKEIISTRSFGQKVQSIEQLRQAVSQYAARATRKLRDQQGFANSIQVFIETSRFDDDYYHPSLVLKTPYPCNDTRIITRLAVQAVNQLFRSGLRYVRAGVGLMNIQTESPYQGDFFAQKQSEKALKLMQTLDQINHLKGLNTTYFAAQGIQQNWAMQRHFKSPAYTTQWQDLPLIIIR
ncbi:MAG: UMUC domain-containing protein DNA-repair protein [Gammaproteobacteria bacterium CG22_combo_CG10-13_8_21_14_all_40_8]|nr:MAG: UMUC domain-containing protein DNA-repair protein [Gammaproteobacteria bacterium CG22_combo_CG10-13_8_21_14_all_40_8]